MTQKRKKLQIEVCFLHVHIIASLEILSATDANLCSFLQPHIGLTCGWEHQWEMGVIVTLICISISANKSLEIITFALNKNQFFS